MTSIEMKLLDVNDACMIETTAQLLIEVGVFDVEWLIATARKLLSLAPYATLGVVVFVDGDFYKFYSKDML